MDQQGLNKHHVVFKLSLLKYKYLMYKLIFFFSNITCNGVTGCTCPNIEGSLYGMCEPGLIIFCKNNRQH